ncbi:MAG: GNAT family N-acetyltransferase [Alphaproteobacteria bacterium]
MLRAVPCQSLDRPRSDVSRGIPVSRPRRSSERSGSKWAGDDAIEFRRERLPPLAVLESEWRSLERVSEPSFFISWHWIGTFLNALPEGKRPELLRGLRRGETVALALLGATVLRRRHGLIRSRALFLNETGEADYDLTIEHNGLLVPNRYHSVAVEALIRWFAEDQTGAADEFYIRGLTQPLAGGVVARHGLHREQTEVPSYWVDLGRLAASNGELYPVLSSNARQQLRRATRHFERFGQLRLDRAAHPGEARDFFAELKDLHIATWQRRGKPHSFIRPFFEAFHHQLIDRHVADGTVQVLRASAGSRLIGYLYNFRLFDRVYTYQSGFAYDETGARPGAVAHALAIRDAYHSGASVYDFLAGRNRLKESYGTTSAPMFWEVVQQPRLGFRAERIARSVKQRLETRLAGLPHRKRMSLADVPPVSSGRKSSPVDSN